jgi:uncharacterized protein
MKSKLTIFAFFLFSIAGSSQQSIIGSWTGELDIQGMKLPLVFNIKEKENTITATLDSPKQGAKDIPVSKATFVNNELEIEVANIDLLYKGKLTNNKIEGIFTQGNMELPLVLSPMKEVGDFVLKRPQTPKAPFDYHTEEVSFENASDKNTLAGTISIPKDKKNFPIVIMITGSGVQNRDEELFGHKPFAVIADDFAKKGIATLRIDDRGAGGSSKGAKSPTMVNFATDINAAVEFLTQKGYTNIGLLGHSEGGMIAPMVATTNKKVKFIISMAGPATKIEDLMNLQIEKGGLLSGEKPEKVKLDVAMSRKAFHFMTNYKGGELLKELENLLLTALQKYPDDLINKKNIEEIAKAQAKTYSSPWFVYLIKFNPKGYIAKVKVPVLAINGEKDFQVDAKSNLEAFKNILSKSGNRKFETVSFPGMNHLFQECKTGAFEEYGEIEQTISPKVLDKMSSWILQL